MVGQIPGIPCQQGFASTMPSLGEPQFETRKWYFSRQEIEDSSPSRKDGIDFEKESQLQKMYCSVVQELGKNLKVPQVTIACALILCHRFYMRQSHAKNDWQTIATVSMFLACKVEETPRLLRDVVVVAYEMMHKWDPSAPERIRRIEFYSKQKELITNGERLLLSTIAFDLDIQLPYKPLVDALKKLKIFPDLAKVAWNFVNDWLCTTLCLQYKPPYIAAGSMFLAAKFQKVKLPTEKGKVWWLEFDISPKQLEVVIQQMLRLLEQDRKQALPLTHGRVTQSKASVGKTVAHSPESTVTSVSIANSQSSDGAVIESVALDARNMTVKEVLPCQIRDSGASILIEDGCGERLSSMGEFVSSSSHKTIPAHNAFCKIDAKRIREALKRKRCEGDTNKMSHERKKTEIDSEAWIELELESGIVLESASSAKKQKDGVMSFPC